MAKDLLFEIGVEEIPASYIPPAIDQLAAAVERELHAGRLSFAGLRTFATPRRLAVIVSQVDDRQEDVERDVVGPPARAAFAEDGTPTKAAIGFARSKGVDVADLEVRDTGSGDYVHVHIVDHGRPSDEVLPELMRAALDSVSFPKTMQWGTGDRFARPVRWLVAMLGGVSLDMEYAGVRALPETWGHRHWSPGPHPLTGAGDYLTVLEKNYVVADAEKRRSSIITAAKKGAEECGGSLVKDDALLDEVTFLVEYPSVFAGRFDERFLVLPREVIIVAMRSHQRYFAVEAGDGSLKPFFLCVANAPQGSLDGIRAGNERVLVSRLDDAAFYWEEDTRESFAGKVDALRSVVWLEGLGSLFEKTERLERLAQAVGKLLASAETDTAVRAAHLAKADLVTEMVRDGKEFTELQGVMGREYALASDEPAGVATAIYEHYLPRFAGDLLPSTEAGTILSIADRLDSIIGCFSAGFIPSGSQDPYALRRQAIGLVRMILEGDLDLSLGDLVRAAERGFDVARDSAEPVYDAVISFIRQRARSVFIEEGFAYDLVDAVLETCAEDLVGARKRIVALSHFREADDFGGLVIGSRRVVNILKGKSPGALEPLALVEAASRSLEEARAGAEAGVKSAVLADDLDGAVRELLSLRRPIDDFFDSVMVMTEDDALRAARLALLGGVRNLFTGIADFSKVVLEGEQVKE